MTDGAFGNLHSQRDCYWWAVAAGMLTLAAGALQCIGVGGHWAQLLVVQLAGQEPHPTLVQPPFGCDAGARVGDREGEEVPHVGCRGCGPAAQWPSGAAGEGEMQADIAAYVPQENRLKGPLSGGRL
jgi:hypothetical protein